MLLQPGCSTCSSDFFVSFHLIQEPTFTPLTALSFGACTLWAVSFPKDPWSQPKAEGCVLSGGSTGRSGCPQREGS